MFVHNDGPCDRQALSSTLSNLFGGEKRVENSSPDVHRNTCSRIRNPNLDAGRTSCGLHLDLALRPVLPIAKFTDCVGRVDNQVQNHLIELPRQAVDEW